MTGVKESSRSKMKPAAVALSAVVFVVLTTVALLAARPTPALAVLSDPIAICPDPIAEGDSDRMGMRWPGLHPVGVKYFYATVSGHTADHSDFAAYGRMTVYAQGDSETLWLPVVTTQDDRPEHDETFEIGTPTIHGWFSCVITIVDDDAPTITEVAVTSTPARGDTYRSGENIDITLTFDMAVDVAGDAWLTLRVGAGDHHTPREARYLRGSGTRHLVFRYLVQPSDSDPDGIAVRVTGRDDGSTHGLGGTYARGTDVPVDHTHAGLESASNHRVDGRPYVKSVGVISTPPDGWESYRADQTIEIALTFDTAVVMEGEVRLGLYVGLVRDNWGEAWREADYLRGSGTDTLVFGYTVVPGDTDIRGIAIPGGGTAVLGDGTIKADGTDVESQMHFPATGHLPDHQIDTVAPRVSGVYVTSRPANRHAYQTGEVIRVEVVFSEPVAKSGDLQLELDIGGANRRASLLPDANPDRRFNNDMTFEYRVQADDTDPDGIEISADSIQLNGGAIHDRAGNAADLSHQPVAADLQHQIHTHVDH